MYWSENIQKAAEEAAASLKRPPETTARVNVYAMNDCDWVAAETTESAIQFYLDMVSEKDTPENRLEFLEEPIEPLSADDMERLRFHDEDGKVRSFAEQLAKKQTDGQTFPAFFASTEY